jgi:hypothetical protein
VPLWLELHSKPLADGILVNIAHPTTSHQALVPMPLRALSYFEIARTPSQLCAVNNFRLMSKIDQIA